MIPKTYKDMDDDAVIRCFADRIRLMIKNEGLADVKLFPASNPNTTIADFARGSLILLDADTVEDKGLF